MPEGMSSAVVNVMEPAFGAVIVWLEPCERQYATASPSGRYNPSSEAQPVMTHQSVTFGPKVMLLNAAAAVDQLAGPLVQPP